MLKEKKTFVITILVSFFIIASIGNLKNVNAQSDNYNGIINIAVIIDDDLPDYSIALGLDPRINATYFNEDNISLFENSISNFNTTFILDFNLLSLQIIEYIKDNVSSGMGLYFQANNISESYSIANLNSITQILPINISVNSTNYGVKVESEYENIDSINTRVNETGQEFLLQRIGFISLPQLLFVTDSSEFEGSSVLVATGTGEPIISSKDYGNGRVLSLCAPIKTDTNEHLADWPYFTYFIFSSAMYLSGIENFEEYGQWNYSPLPQDGLKIIILVIIIVIVSITLIGFIYMKKKSASIPLKILPPSQGEIKALEYFRDIKDQKNKLIQEDIQISKEKIDKKEKKSIKDDIEWNLVGYHKPLSGFIMMFFLSLCLILPLIVIVLYLLPTFILTDPSQMGITFITGNIFSAVFIAGDFGLAQAFDRFVSKSYINDTEKALKYIQFFVWFQMLSGLVQTGGIALIGLYIIPESMALAFMSYQFVAKAFIQWPGTGYLFTHSLKALQRTDKEQMVNLIGIILFDVAGFAIFSGIFLGIGAQNPMIGKVIGGSIGIVIGEVFKSFGMMLVSGIVFARIDKRFSIWSVFRVDFDMELVKETLWFGLKSMLSTVIFLFGNFAVTIIIMLQLDNYTYWGTFIGSATFLLYPITFMIILYESALPTTAEAYGNDCVHLTEVYISYGWKYFGVFATLVFACFFFFLSTFLTNILPDLYKPMGFFMGFYSITKLLIGLGDFSRLFLIAIDKVSMYILFVTLEQILRLIFIISLINRISHPEYLLIFGELPGVLLKVILIWLYTNKKVIKVRINLWQTFVAPLIATLSFILIGYVFMGIYNSILINADALIPTIIFAFIIFGGLTISVYPLILALVGGWDDETMRQLRFSVKHSGPSKPFAKIFLKLTEIGNKISPLYNKHPIDFSKAYEDVETLMNLKLDNK